MRKIISLGRGFGAKIEGAVGDRIEHLQRNEIIDQFRSNGMIWFHNFNCKKEDYEKLSENLCDQILVHQSKNRKNIDPKGFTTTVTVGTSDFQLHRERSHLPHAPDVLFFYCSKPAETGGQTTVCDGIEVYSHLSKGTKRFLESHSFLHDLVLEPVEWGKAFHTDDINVALAGVKELAAAASSDEKVEVEHDDTSIRVLYHCPCIWKTKYGNQKAFVHELLLYLNVKKERADYYEGKPFYPAGNGAVYLGDGSLFPLEILLEIEKVANSLTFGVNWKQGDIVMVDNSRFMHGRKGFTGDREILFRMGFADFAKSAYKGIRADAA